METVPCTPQADQWKADCEKAGWAQCWSDVARHARAQGDASWQTGTALVLSGWALLGLIAAVLA